MLQINSLLNSYRFHIVLKHIFLCILLSLIQNIELVKIYLMISPSSDIFNRVTRNNE